MDMSKRREWKQKEKTAEYYDKLYSFDANLEKHAHHEYVRTKIKEYELNRKFDELWYNELPSKKEIEEIIKRKKNKKATTNFPNEILKEAILLLTVFILL